MKSLLLFVFVLIGYTGLLAQDSTLVTVKAGYKVNDVLTPADIYFYPQFIYSKIYFKDGTVADPYMNYNRLFDQMLFINSKGDTLALVDEKTIDFIVNDWDIFYYDGGYMRLIADDSTFKVAEKQVWVVADIRKIGTHNRPTTTVAIQSLTAYTNGQDAAKSKDLVLNEDILLRKETQYYFGDEFNQFVRANKKKLLNLFPKAERRIEDYLKENNINFDKKDDLEKLFQFIRQLN